MSWIKVLGVDDVKPGSRLDRLYKACLNPGETIVDNVLTIHSLRPDTLDGHLKLYKSVMWPKSEDGLTKRERETIAVTVSATNECHY